MDNKLTEAIQAYLSSEEKNIPEGAMLLLRLNRNRILYQNIIKKPEKFASKLEYELKKHLNIRLEGYTMQQVGELDNAVKELAEKTKEFTYEKGMRSDHAELPEPIQSLFTSAHNKMVEMRHLHEKLKLMEEAEPCDRFPFLKSLAVLHEEYRECYNKYDAYREGDEIETETPADIAKHIASARNYISVTRDKLRKLLTDDEASPEASVLRNRLKEKYDYLSSHDAAVGDEIKEDLASMGVEV